MGILTSFNMVNEKILHMKDEVIENNKLFLIQFDLPVQKFHLDMMK
jgi:hypothetical protein